jgi:hypothetical protein
MTPETLEAAARSLAQHRRAEDQAEAGGCDVLLALDAYLPQAREDVAADLRLAEAAADAGGRELMADGLWSLTARDDLKAAERAALHEAMRRLGLLAARSGNRETCPPHDVR